MQSFYDLTRNGFRKFFYRMHAKDVKETKNLIETGFEYVGEYQDKNLWKTQICYPCGVVV